MMANIAASFPPHAGGMQQHPGAPPGHPMQPGMGHNPNQPGPGMPQHMVAHMGVSGPGPQINPAALMGGMPPGAGGPNAHAMQHLNPAQAQMFQQQHTMCECHASPGVVSASLADDLNVVANSPAVQAQMQQQQRLQVLQQQQQVRQALMTQQTGNQVGYGNINMHAMGMPLSSMNPQQAAQQAAQLAALRSRMPVSSLLPQFQQAQFAQHQQGQPMNVRHTSVVFPPCSARHCVSFAV
ncbi:hypothetical protein QBC47DRAFT_215879 [Echria macrotheca]|uniref:Uncharacterized protein n=1 Tax=Echria macrotheca TaxID=438768 RepID=A0AAJ0BCM9_9PEZI|nr:hypothetical protein QBC47DRAFT_215879 [Echria macrotheca]